MSRCPLSFTGSASTTGSSMPSPPLQDPRACSSTWGATPTALSNRRILRVDADQVAFRYRDYADGNRLKVMELSVHEFLRRFLLHLLPQGFVRIRHYGLLANRSRRSRIARCRELLAATAPQPAAPAKEDICEKLLRLTGVDLTLCPACGEGCMRVIAELDKHDAITARVAILDSS